MHICHVSHERLVSRVGFHTTRPWALDPYFVVLRGHVVKKGSLPRERHPTKSTTMKLSSCYLLLLLGPFFAFSLIPLLLLLLLLLLLQVLFILPRLFTPCTARGWQDLHRRGLVRRVAGSIVGNNAPDGRDGGCGARFGAVTAAPVAAAAAAAAAACPVALLLLPHMRNLHEGAVAGRGARKNMPGHGCR